MGESRGFGFLKFFTLKHARDFMEERSPSIRFGDYRARIAYSNNPSNNNASRDSPSKQAGYQASGHHRSQQQQSTLNFQGRGGQPFEHATQFYQQHSLQPHQQTSLNTGMQDIGQVPYSILLAMDLPPMVNEMGLWNAFNTLGPLRRVMMAKDRQSRMNLGYCFAEYRDTESATAALEKAHSASFSIQKKPVVVHFASRASFIPAYAPTKWTLDFANECELALYWDEQAFLSIYEEQPAKSSKSAVQDLATSVDELDAFYASLGDLSKSGTSAGGRAAIFSLPSASSDALPAVQELPSLPSAAKMDDIQLAGIAAAHEAEQLAKAEDRKRKAAPPSIGIGGGGKKVSLNLQKWSTKQVELHSDDTTAAIPAQVSTMSSSNTMPVTIRKIEQPTGFVPVPSPQKSLQPQQQQLEQQEDIEDWNSYDPDELLDLKLVACLLCQRKFKTEVELRKHQSLSDLHKKNLADPQAVQSALRKARSKPQGNNNTAQSPGSSPAKKTLAGVGATGDDEPKYRDRAAERRQIFGQPDYPLPPMPAAGSRHAGSFGRDRGGFEESVIPEQPTKDGIKEDNIGNRLLKSMGWKEGQGLGKDGGGIRDPIQASGYSRGVGIGAGVVGPGGSSGSSDRRGGTGGGGYQALSAKELARRRYEQSGQQQ
ncbi:hypothetical protein BGZ83_006769 [Gryganskiella cystojenkinii]|nr:hypothetical protein BGZ83_006769 [Gryganskiella cystojenkinii]